MRDYDPEYLSDEIDDFCECDSPFSVDYYLEEMRQDSEWDYEYNDGEWEYYEDIERDYGDFDW